MFLKESVHEFEAEIFAQISSIHKGNHQPTFVIQEHRVFLGWLLHREILGQASVSPCSFW